MPKMRQGVDRAGDRYTAGQEEQYSLTTGPWEPWIAREATQLICIEQLNPASRIFPIDGRLVHQYRFSSPHGAALTHLCGAPTMQEVKEPIGKDLPHQSQ